MQLSVLFFIIGAAALADGKSYRIEMSQGVRCGRGMSQQDALSLRCLGRDVADARLEKTSPSTDVPLGSFM